MQVLVSVKIETRYPRPGKELSNSDLQLIKDILQFKKEPVTPVAIVSKKAVEAAIAPEPKINLDELYDGYILLETRAKALGELLDKRIGAGLNMPIDIKKNPEVWEAAHRLFGGNFTEISYHMFRQLVDYMESLGRAMAEATDK